MTFGRNQRARELGIDLNKQVMYSPVVEKVTKEYLMKKVGDQNVTETFRCIEVSTVKG